MSERVGREARALPGKSHGWLRRWFKKVWELRGGGLYACGFAVTFLVLEAGSIIEDVKQIDLLFDGRALDFVLNFVIDSFKNTLHAFMWPVDVVKFAPPYGVIGLGLAFWLFPMTLQKPIEAWLFSDDENTSAADSEADTSEKQ